MYLRYHFKEWGLAQKLLSQLSSWLALSVRM